MGILLFSSLFFPIPSPEFSFVDTEIQYGAFEKKTKKKAFVNNKSLF